MDIVDAQVHANVLGTEVTLAVMDALPTLSIGDIRPRPRTCSMSG